MNIYDVIVVGGGPAGSMAGYYLAEAGLDVLLVDKSQFPRRKVCGGGLTQRAFLECPFDIAPLIHHTVDWGYLGFRGKVICTIKGHGPVAHLIERTTFDDFLVHQAQAQGAHFHQDEKALSIEQTTGAVTLRTDKDKYRTSFLIGADGIHSVVAAQTHLMQDGTSSLSYEARLKLPEDPVAEHTDSITFDFGTLTGGYAWIFPKHDHLNVGVYRNWPGKRTSREHLLRYIRQHPALHESEILDIRAFPGPTGGTPGPLHRGRVLLAGDAAHLVDPWLGEGIYYAMANGRLAAETIIAQIEQGSADLSPYSNQINDTFVTRFQYARKIALAVNLSYGLNVRLLRRSPTLQAAIVDLLRGDRTHKEIWLGATKHFTRSAWKILRKK
ncbi:geranylgeranyl reductase family protein [bacterium]|nr:geranylgeranyl reductase family protein [bacterium]